VRSQGIVCSIDHQRIVNGISIQIAFADDDNESPPIGRIAHRRIWSGLVGVARKRDMRHLDRVSDSDASLVGPALRVHQQRPK